MHNTLEAPPPGIIAADNPGTAPPPASRPPVSRRIFLSAAAIAALVAAAGPVVGQATSARADWGPYRNGEIPLDALTPIPWKPSLYLRSDAVAALVALNASFRKQFGRDLPLSDAYRDLPNQVKARQDWCARGHCENAAIPGQSNHGWAVAIDIGIPIDGWTNSIYLWMKSNAPQWGWIHPNWAEPGGQKPDEAWHWEYTGVYKPTPETSATENNVEAIVKAPNGIVVHLRPGGKTNFGTPQEYNLFRDQIAFLRNAGATDVMALPELSTVPGVTWDTFIYLSRYIGAPE